MRNKQAGGIVSFIIVAVALAGLLAGGLYLSKQQGRTARDADTSTPEVTTTEQKGTENTEEEAAKPTPEANAGTAQNQPQSTPNTPPNQRTTPPTSNNPRTDRVASTGPSEAIPSTGPTETIAVSLGLGTLVFTVYRFTQSRRALRTSALRR